MRAIVVGARGATRDLLRRLSERWSVTVVDSDPDLLARAQAVRDIETIQGDGSSRVVLEKARYAEADAIVAAAGDDEVNLEVCRLALDAGMVRLVAVAADPEHIQRYRDLGVPVFSPDSLTARQLEISLEPRRISSTAFAAGRAEALEFLVAEDSPVRGMALRDLHSESWLVATILRGDTLIVPHGSTTIQTGDLVTVVGATSDFPLIVRTFTAGEARFPLDFGKGVLVAFGSVGQASEVLAEAMELTRNSPAEALVVAHPDPGSIREESEATEVQAMLEEIRGSAEGVDVRFHPVSGDPTRRIKSVVEDESIGLVVVPGPGRSFLGRFRAIRMLRRAADWDRPVLFARGSHPYQRIVTPARETSSGTAAARAAIDLAGDGRAAVTAVAVVPPTFITGSDGREAAVRALARVREEAAVLDVSVRRLLRQGNPVRIIESAVTGADLLVLGMSARRPTIFSPGIVGHLLQRVDVSTLVVPSAQ
ncbi:MAG TPA: NAD-binding protein [Acidimicrobiia bacterium]|nr:NAD-binding protein [Acidimicrobiia bacterium]